MIETTPRWHFPFILPGQAQKELFHNEALLAADAVLHPAVDGGPQATPPDSASPGQCWLLTAGATGAWSGHDHALATWTASGWRFADPVPGMQVWHKGLGLRVHWTGTAWSDGSLIGSRLIIGGQQVVGERQPSVPSPSGGTIIDAEARVAVDRLIVALRSHGLIV